MKLCIVFLMGVVAGAAIAAAAAAALSTPSIDLTVHDARGRTKHGTATLNSIYYNRAGTTMFLDVATDSLGCYAFEVPSP